MQVTGSYTFDSLPSDVWAVLVNPGAVAGCVPGCKAFEALGSDKYRATMAIGIASVKGQYEGTVAILDQQPGESFRLVIEGSGTPGFVRGAGIIHVVEKGDKTQVDVIGDAEIGGVIGRVGQRILGRASKLLIDEYFKCMRKKVTSTRVRS
jgi:carbon monoxide dehydrogenase subunit G